MSTPIDIIVDSAGCTIPAYEQILAYFTASYQSIYGSDVALTADTQDGQWLAIQAQAYSDLCNVCLTIYNAYSPSTAQGANLSSVVKINGLARDVPSASFATVTIVGQAGITINNGLIGDNLGLGTVWALPATVTIPIGGTITATATCVTTGAVSATAGSLSSILTPTQGWQSVTNGADATVGSPTEDDADLRQRQAQSTSLPAQTPLEAIFANVADIPGVGRCAAYENDTDITDGNGLIPHSIAIVVQAGTAATIAAAIAAKKSPGTGTNGTTSVVVIDQNGVPDTIKFYFLTVVQLDIAITLKQLPGFVTSTSALVQAAVAAFVSGLAIGEESYFTRLYSPANLSGDAAVSAVSAALGSPITQAQLDVISATYNVTSLTQAIHGGMQAPADIAIAFNQAAAAVVANIAITLT